MDNPKNRGGGYIKVGLMKDIKMSLAMAVSILHLWNWALLVDLHINHQPSPAFMNFDCSDDSTWSTPEPSSLWTQEVCGTKLEKSLTYICITAISRWLVRLLSSFSKQGLSLPAKQTLTSFCPTKYSLLRYFVTKISLTKITSLLYNTLTRTSSPPTFMAYRSLSSL